MAETRKCQHCGTTKDRLLAPLGDGSEPPHCRYYVVCRDRCAAQLKDAKAEIATLREMLGGARERDYLGHEGNCAWLHNHPRPAICGCGFNDWDLALAALLHPPAAATQDKGE